MASASRFIGLAASIARIGFWNATKGGSHDHTFIFRLVPHSASPSRLDCFSSGPVRAVAGAVEIFRYQSICNTFVQLMRFQGPGVIASSRPITSGASSVSSSERSPLYRQAS